MMLWQTNRPLCLEDQTAQGPHLVGCPILEYLNANIKLPKKSRLTAPELHCPATSR